MQTRSYEFHRDGGAVWALVYDTMSGQWRVKKTERENTTENFTLEEFDASSFGKRLGKYFDGALRQAEADL